MVNIDELCVGDRVKIVDEWCYGCDLVGIVDEMEEFRGKIVTIHQIFTAKREEDHKVITIEEDPDKWCFNRWMIDYRIDDSMDVVDSISEDALSSVLFS